MVLLFGICEHDFKVYIYIEKNDSLPVFPYLDASHAFEKCQQSGILYKLKLLLSSHNYLIFKSFFQDRSFTVRLGSSFSLSTQTKARVPQGAAIAPLLFNIFISDHLTLSHTPVGDFSDDKVIMFNISDPDLAFFYIHVYLPI